MRGYIIEHLPAEFSVCHIDDSLALKNVRTWFYYGVGRALREKRNYLLGKCGRLDYIKSLFPGSSLTDRGDSPVYIGFVALHYLIRTLGVLYGVFVKWRNVDLRFLEDAGLT